MEQTATFFARSVPHPALAGTGQEVSRSAAIFWAIS